MDMDSDTLHVELKTKNLLTTSQAWHYRAIPSKDSGSVVDIYVDSLNMGAEVLEELELIVSKEIRPTYIPAANVDKLLSLHYRKGEKTLSSTKGFENVVDGDFVVRMINEADSMNASDIHIEPSENAGRVRYRIDGKLLSKYEVAKQEFPSLINKIKIRAKLDIAEKRLPQDGRIFFKSEDAKLDLRVSVIPTLYGEKIVMRLLGSDAGTLELSSVGLIGSSLETYQRAVAKPHGIVLISGPTGSGKTTTLYATLGVLNQEDLNIVTVEDPVEYTLDGINQVSVQSNIGLDFARGLRSFLRQDPDVIMVGEIRDGETAQIAVRAALTGHLVLSTIHTNSAIDTITRLMDMGVPPYYIAATLNCSVSQRLIRKLCLECKRKIQVDEHSAHKQRTTNTIEETVYEAVGCNTCHFTGYKGRLAIFEVLEIDEQLRSCIRENKVYSENIFKEKSFDTLKDSALKLYRAGLTSWNEIRPFAE